MKKTMKRAWRWCADVAWGVWMMLTGWREWIAEERQTEAEGEEERLRSAWKLARERKERAFEAEGRAA